MPVCGSPSSSGSSYPEITKQGRRTGRALRNICFFVWCCARDDDRELIPTLFRAAVLLSAQDDYYDNPRISAAQKESFCRATNHALRTNSFQPAFERSRPAWGAYVPLGRHRGDDPTKRAGGPFLLDREGVPAE